MKKIFSSPFSFLILSAAILLLTSCGGGFAATETSATESATEPAATEAPPETEFPLTEVVAVTSIPYTATSGGGTSQNATAVPAIPEQRRLTLEYPPKIKAAAESDIVRLTLEVDALGNITPTVETSGHVVEGNVIEIPNLYDTHNVTIEAQYDVAGLEVRPPGATFQPLKPGESVTFRWSVRAQDVGTYRGTIWLYLNFENRSSGEKSREVLSAQVVDIEAVDFFGFSVNFVRTSGVVGSVLGLVVGFPFFDDVVKYLWGKRKKEEPKLAKGKRKK